MAPLSHLLNKVLTPSVDCGDCWHEKSHYRLKGLVWVAAFARSDMNGLRHAPFERTIKQTQGTMPKSPQKIATATQRDQ